MIIKADPGEIRLAVDYIRNALKKKRIKSEEIVRATLSAEEMLHAMIAHSDKPDGKLHVHVISWLGSTEIRITGRGKAFSIAEIQEGEPFRPEDDTDETAREALRSLFDRLMKDRISLRNRQGINIAAITVARSRYRRLIITFCALAAGILAGILMKSFLADDFTSAVSANLLTPVSTMFLNALKMIVGPLVLFSIASSVADFGDMKTLGRVVGRVVTGYMFTSVIAILAGILIWHVFPIGNPALKEAVDASAASSVTGKAFSVSLKDTVVGIIPSDIISPFLNMNMLQIIFIAVMIGIAAGLVSAKLQVMKAFLTDGYLIFSKITSMIIAVMPLAIFCSMAKMVLGMNLTTLLSVFSWIPVCYVGCILMLVVYGILIPVFSGLNPLKFFGKYYPAMLTAYSFASSNASLPTSMQYCGESLGISRRIYSISLPLGATINMDGSCVVLCVSALFMAKIFGIPVSAPLLVTLMLSVLLLSVGAPGVPGAALICLSILLPQIGVPAEAISLVMGLYPLVGMILVCVNVTGDAAMTLIVARKEQMVDLEVYNR